MFIKELKDLQKNSPEIFERIYMEIRNLPKPAWSSDGSYLELKNIIVQKFSD